MLFRQFFSQTRRDKPPAQSESPLRRCAPPARGSSPTIQLRDARRPDEHFGPLLEAIDAAAQNASNTRDHGASEDNHCPKAPRRGLRARFAEFSLDPTAHRQTQDEAVRIPYGLVKELPQQHLDEVRKPREARIAARAEEERYPPPTCGSPASSSSCHTNSVEGSRANAVQNEDDTAYEAFGGCQPGSPIRRRPSLTILPPHRELCLTLAHPATVYSLDLGTPSVHVPHGDEVRCPTLPTTCSTHIAESLASSAHPEPWNLADMMDDLDFESHDEDGSYHSDSTSPPSKVKNKGKARADEPLPLDEEAGPSDNTMKGKDPDLIADFFSDDTWGRSLTFDDEFLGFSEVCFPSPPLAQNGESSASGAQYSRLSPDLNPAVDGFLPVSYVTSEHIEYIDSEPCSRSSVSSLDGRASDFVPGQMRQMQHTMARVNFELDAQVGQIYLDDYNNVSNNTAQVDFARGQNLLNSTPEQIPKESTGVECGLGSASIGQHDLGQCPIPKLRVTCASLTSDSSSENETLLEDPCRLRPGDAERLDRNPGFEIEGANALDDSDSEWGYYTIADFIEDDCFTLPNFAKDESDDDDYSFIMQTYRPEENHEGMNQSKFGRDGRPPSRLVSRVEEDEGDTEEIGYDFTQPSVYDASQEDGEESLDELGEFQYGFDAVMANTTLSEASESYESSGRIRVQPFSDEGQQMITFIRQHFSMPEDTSAMAVQEFLGRNPDLLRALFLSKIPHPRWRFWEANQLYEMNTPEDDSGEENLCAAKCIAQLQWTDKRTICALDVIKTYFEHENDYDVTVMMTKTLLKNIAGIESAFVRRRRFDEGDPKSRDDIEKWEEIVSKRRARPRSLLAREVLPGDVKGDF